MMALAYLLTFLRYFVDNPLAALCSAVGIGISSIRKRVQRLLSAFFVPQFYCLWQCAWENRKVRRFFRSGNANPAYAVAILFGINGGSQSKITKGDCNV